MEKAPLGTTAEYNRPSGTVRTEEGRQIESGSVGKHEWSFGKRGLGMTQEGLGALPGLEIRAGRAVLWWNKASRLMRRKASTDMVNLNCTLRLRYVPDVFIKSSGVTEKTRQKKTQSNHSKQTSTSTYPGVLLGTSPRLFSYFGPSRRPPPGARMRVVTSVISTYGSLGAQAQALIKEQRHRQTHQSLCASFACS